MSVNETKMGGELRVFAKFDDKYHNGMGFFASCLRFMAYHSTMLIDGNPFSRIYRHFFNPLSLYPIPKG